MRLVGWDAVLGGVERKAGMLSLYLVGGRYCLIGSGQTREDDRFKEHINAMMMRRGVANVILIGRA